MIKLLHIWDPCLMLAGPSKKLYIHFEKWDNCIKDEAYTIHFSFDTIFPSFKWIISACSSHDGSVQYSMSQMKVSCWSQEMNNIHMSFFWKLQWHESWLLKMLFWMIMIAFWREKDTFRWWHLNQRDLYISSYVWLHCGTPNHPVWNINIGAIYEKWQK